jgi:hypothetical protein
VGCADNYAPRFWLRQRGASETIQVGRALIAEVRRLDDDLLWCTY